MKARIKNVLAYKKPAFWVVLVALIATVTLITIFSANPKNDTLTSTTGNSVYVAETLMTNKTLYVGNNSKVGALVNAMPLPSGMTRDSISLQTSTTPYGITIKYNLNDATTATAQGTLSGDVFYRNSILLFSLIDNVDVITCKVYEPSSMSNGKYYSFTFTRKSAEQLMAEDVRHFANSTDTLKTLINRLTKMSFGVNATSQVSIEDQIEKNLDIIMSAPQTSSNPQDYINAHRNEYNAIIALDAKALPYIFSEFAKGGQTGLKGNIMVLLCEKILGGEDIMYLAKDPQDWYVTYKKLVQTEVSRNSLEWVQEHYPKGSLILSS